MAEIGHGVSVGFEVRHLEACHFGSTSVLDAASKVFEVKPAAGLACHQSQRQRMAVKKAHEARQVAGPSLLLRQARSSGGREDLEVVRRDERLGARVPPPHCRRRAPGACGWKKGSVFPDKGGAESRLAFGMRRARPQGGPPRCRGRGAWRCLPRRGRVPRRSRTSRARKLRRGARGASEPSACPGERSRGHARSVGCPT